MASGIVIMGFITEDMVVFQNNLRGDGLQCFQGQSAGINFTGANSIVDDNNISGVAFGIGMYHDTTGDVNSFNIYSNNSFSNVETGIGINANADPNSVANTPWFFANVFRGNLVSGIASGSNSVFGGGITFITNAKDSASAPLNTSQLLMNVLESNIITDTPKGFQFITTSTPDSGTTSAPGGVVDTVLWNDFASSDGSLGNALFTHIYYGEADSDSSPYILEPNDQWENFFN